MPKNFDQWLIRAKDIVLVLGFAGSLVLFAGKLYGLPDIVATHEGRLIALEKCQIEMATTMKHMAKSVDEIKGHVENYFYEIKK